MVTDIARKDIKYDLDWSDSEDLSKEEIKQKLEDYNNSKNRVLFYPWGIFVRSQVMRDLIYGRQFLNIRKITSIVILIQLKE